MALGLILFANEAGNLVGNKQVVLMFVYVIVRMLLGAVLVTKSRRHGLQISYKHTTIFLVVRALLCASVMVVAVLVLDWHTASVFVRYSSVGGCIASIISLLCFVAFILPLTYSRRSVRQLASKFELNNQNERKENKSKKEVIEQSLTHETVCSLYHA